MGINFARIAIESLDKAKVERGLDRLEKKARLTAKERFEAMVRLRRNEADLERLTSADIIRKRAQRHAAHILACAEAEIARIERTRKGLVRQIKADKELLRD